MKKYWANETVVMLSINESVVEVKIVEGAHLGMRTLMSAFFTF
ncbi:MAG TPA: hypothetical protein VLM88_12430 [Proteiniclasticum sp.]|nr:hypothetical protein [Proteiniclasticum sp.]